MKNFNLSLRLITVYRHQPPSLKLLAHCIGTYYDVDLQANFLLCKIIVHELFLIAIINCHYIIINIIIEQVKIVNVQKLRSCQCRVSRYPYFKVEMCNEFAVDLLCSHYRYLRICNQMLSLSLSISNALLNGKLSAILQFTIVTLKTLHQRLVRF